MSGPEANTYHRSIGKWQPKYSIQKSSLLVKARCVSLLCVNHGSCSVWNRVGSTVGMLSCSLTMKGLQFRVWRCDLEIQINIRTRDHKLRLLCFLKSEFFLGDLDRYYIFISQVIVAGGGKFSDPAKLLFLSDCHSYDCSSLQLIPTNSTAVPQIK